jgi:hypothetical protein
MLERRGMEHDMRAMALENLGEVNFVADIGYDWLEARRSGQDRQFAVNLEDRVLIVVEQDDGRNR